MEAFERTKCSEDLKALGLQLQGKEKLTDLNKDTKKLINSPIVVEYVTTMCVMNEGRRHPHDVDCTERKETYNIRNGTRSKPVMEDVSRNVLTPDTTILVSTFLFFSVCMRLGDTNYT